MKNSNTADRLKYIMASRNLKQVDIVEACQPLCQKYGVKMTKSSMSHYVNGTVEPSQIKLIILGMVLNVDESWLMGYDVPMERGGWETESIYKKTYSQTLEEGKRNANKRIDDFFFKISHENSHEKSNKNRSVKPLFLQLIFVLFTFN